MSAEMDVTVGEPIVLLTRDQADEIKGALNVLAPLLERQAEAKHAEIENELEDTLATVAKLTDTLDGHTIDEDDDTEASI